MTFSKNLRLALFALTLCAISPAHAWDGDTSDWSNHKKGFIKKLMERKKNNASDIDSDQDFNTKGKGFSHTETIGGRSFIIYSPPSHETANNAPLLIVLHGGFGNAKQIQSYIGLDALADEYGFVVAYLHGTQVSSKLPPKFRGWNADGCCGLPQKNNVDDLGFIKNVISVSAAKYGIDQSRVYGTGHSNGAMMTLRVMCETDLYQSAVTMSGTLQTERKSCPTAKDKALMNIHGAEDKNLPPEGGRQDSGFNPKTDYKSQQETQDLFAKSGAEYKTLLLKDAGHTPESINGALIKDHGSSLPHTIVNYLTLKP